MPDKRKHLKGTTMGTLVDYTTDKGVAVLTLDDPPVNAYTHEMLRELDACILEARFDADVHVLVITGHGEHFCAGANLNMLREADQQFRYYFALHASETFARLEHTPKLCVAALNGHALGAGLELALACDLRVARGGPFKFGLPAVNLGIVPGGGGASRLTRLLGKGRAMQLLVEGSTLNVEEALSVGLVNKVWASESSRAFVQQAIDYAHEFTPPHRAALAVGQIKRAVQAGEGGPGEHAAALEGELQASSFLGADAREGLAAFSAKRRPTFRGR